ncbi:hypothetical protein NIE88_04765 [Sporolactobacillus shoreicorticis]|uniref:Uncharacterized protein n=1 Tax=Sporolactobacillus shoreicorticis TaxID=1923877 RepID=A0ABW5RY72_9BACL|nr:hypothetical protein [Sporolactobacillus shoreicorticis]MCO7125085.1 hypothetical protein [Sporolactobacillus shoreicorticis]
MKQDDERALLIFELKRVIDLLGQPKNETETESWMGSKARAELKAKFREIRRDTVRYEISFLKW